MKQILTALLFISLLGAVVVVASEKAAEKSASDILIARITGDYEKTLSDADALYEKSIAPLLTRYGNARDKKILTAGSNAIRRFNSARKGASELVGIRMEQEIARIRKSIDDRVGDAPTVTPRASALKVCGVSFKGRTYLAIASNAHWKEANALCRKMGGHLAYIETAEELAFLAKTFRANLWVGATDAHREGSWRWGNGKPVTRNLWNESEPSNLAGEHYAALFTNSKGHMLHDIALNNRSVVGFICEWE
ncbi:MAG: C-type lectin domain-containing protein [Phycisphaerae bacterium]|nr:C-type lectin domain-containing protein [Phycisphaerae bacterium]